MAAGDRIAGPRCGEPMTYYVKPDRADSTPLCYRRAGHPGRHMSRWAYLKSIERSQRRRQERAGK